MGEREATVQTPESLAVPAERDVESRPRRSLGPGVRRRIPLIVIGLASLSGPILLLTMLDHGIHLSPDSYTYLGVASNLAHGKGWTYPFNTPGAPLTVFPPLYSSFLSAGNLLHVNALAWAQWQNAFLFGILELVAGLGVYRSTEGSVPAALIGMVLVLVGVPVILSYSAVLSETLFYSLELLALFLLASHIRTRRTRYLVLAAVATGLCMLTRYSGLSVLLSGCALVIVWPKRRILERVRLLATYAALMPTRKRRSIGAPSSPAA